MTVTTKPRDQEARELKAQGLSRPEIAARMGVAPDTVSRCLHREDEFLDAYTIADPEACWEHWQDLAKAYPHRVPADAVRFVGAAR